MHNKWSNMGATATFQMKEKLGHSLWQKPPLGVTSVLSRRGSKTTCLSATENSHCLSKMLLFADHTKEELTHTNTDRYQANVSNAITEYIYHLWDSEVPFHHFFVKPGNLSSGVQENDSLCDCKSFIQITQGLQFPFLGVNGETSCIQWSTITHLTLSLLRVINVEFPQQPHHKYYSRQYGELDFS